MNIIIVGAGALGTHLAKMLAMEYHDILVIDSEAHKLEQLTANTDLLVLEGSCTSLPILKEANVIKADLFVAVTNDENTNILSAMLAKRLGSKKVIARIDNYDYLLPNNKKMFQNMGIDSLIYPESLAVREVISLLGHTGTTEFVDFSGGKLSLAVIRLEEDAPVINLTLEEVVHRGEPPEFRAVAITREGETIIPQRDDRFKVNDLVYVVTNQRGASQMQEYSGKKNIAIRDVMIVGGGRIGTRVALELEKEAKVKIIERNKEECIRLANILKNTLVINADARDTEMLIQEDLGNMDAFIAVTGSSETNILTSLAAKRMGVKKTIAEVENLDYISLSENMGIDTVINKKLISASRIFRYTKSAEVSAIRYLTGSDAVVLEFVVKPNSPATKGKLKDVSFPKNAIIGGVVRGDSAFIATGLSEIKANDRVLVFALPSVVAKVEKFFS